MRALKVEVERHKLAADELRRRTGRPDPRIAALEGEMRALRADLAVARADRDRLVTALRDAVAQLRRALGR